MISKTKNARATGYTWNVNRLSQSARRTRKINNSEVKNQTSRRAQLNCTVMQNRSYVWFIGKTSQHSIFEHCQTRPR